jgi:hypothetical protein
MPGKLHTLGNGGAGHAPAPSLDNFSRRHAVGKFVENLPDHDAGAFERGFAVADLRVGHNVFAQFNALAASIFHVSNLIALRGNDKRDWRSRSMRGVPGDSSAKPPASASNKFLQIITWQDLILGISIPCSLKPAEKFFATIAVKCLGTRCESGTVAPL